MELDDTFMFIKRINEYINKWTTVLMYLPSLSEFLDWVPQPFSVAGYSLQIRSYQVLFLVIIKLVKISKQSIRAKANKRLGDKGIPYIPCTN